MIANVNPFIAGSQSALLVPHFSRHVLAEDIDKARQFVNNLTYRSGFEEEGMIGNHSFESHVHAGGLCADPWLLSLLYNTLKRSSIEYVQAINNHGPQS